MIILRINSVILSLTNLISFTQSLSTTNSILPILTFPNTSISITRSSYSSLVLQSSLLLPPTECPPCNPFNCVLPAFNCLNTGKCNDYNGQCICPAGYGGEDCSKPLCGSLADGNNRFPREGDTCQCDEGWGGLNCNVCETNKACSALVIRDPTSIRGGASDLVVQEEGGDGEEDDGQAVCYKEGYGIKEMFQMCDVTNQKILDMLPNRPPQVTFTCDIPSSTCGFQFWIGSIESFYCGLSKCSTHLETGYESNYTEYNCLEMECSCIPGKMLCGEDGSVDISEFLTEEIKGPAKFSTRTGEGSKFEEPAMNQLITDIFGDPYITLTCSSGECMHVSSVPGFMRPPKPSEKKMVLVSIGIVASVLLIGLFLFWYYGRSSLNTIEYSFLGGRIRLPSSNSDDNDGTQSPINGKSLLENHIPTALQFSNLSYKLPNGKIVLDNITGSVQPGEIMAVIGASGAGKSTFLDLLARKSKTGSVTGEILVNGKNVTASEYRRVVGFVDQEDTLMGTLTVYETVLYSALLRLPREMSLGEKKLRTLETMFELGILGIRDSRIGESGKRSISGGEKRRVSIACELVTSPSILFLDEPTSGLDSYNAFNVIESLVQLSRNYKRTVIFTIHQPRSNIVALFDKLILLSNGKMVYSGQTELCQNYFEKNGSKCPTGYNIADYLIDLTMQSDEKSSTPSIPLEEALVQLSENQDPELGNNTRPNRSTSLLGATELSNRATSVITPPTGLSALFSSTSYSRSASGTSTPISNTTTISPHLLTLVETFSNSDIAKSTKLEISEAKRLVEESGHLDGDVVVLRSYERANWVEQFKILSGRAFKNLYRDPGLMVSHYAVSVVVACICAVLFRNLTLDIPGFQGRMGVFFFILALFGFGSLSTLNAFSSERLLFIRERANGYYSPITYFTAKLLFDIIPLRVVPAFVLGAIIYSPLGLVQTSESFWKFILVLVLFNLTASSAVLLLGVLIQNVGVANLAGSLVMLFNLLFAGLLINRDSLPWYLKWLETFSFFHAAFEALLVNEVRLLSLKDHRYGVDIEVPAATILSMFGFRAQAFWFPDVALLVGLFLFFTSSAFLALVFLVRERR